MFYFLEISLYIVIEIGVKCPFELTVTKCVGRKKEKERKEKRRGKRKRKIRSSSSSSSSNSNSSSK